MQQFQLEWHKFKFPILHNHITIAKPPDKASGYYSVQTPNNSIIADSSMGSSQFPMKRWSPIVLHWNLGVFMIQP
jgi:hypothetical protein